MTIVFDNDVLLPAPWRRATPSNGVRVFNPTLLPIENGWLFAYRVVAEPDLRRRIAVCRLDREFRVIQESPQPWSDWVNFPPNDYPPQATTWFADPRLYQLNGRVFVYWNSGWHEPRNYQFLQEIDVTTLRPIGAPRELMLSGARQKLEKNWMLFESATIAAPTPAPRSDRGTGLFAIYSVQPHRVLSFSLAGSGPIEFADVSTPAPNPRGYAQVHGGLRGGAPPQRVGDYFYSFCHSIENGHAGYEYVMGVYRFRAAPPFLPASMPVRPLQSALSPWARRTLPKLNTAVDAVIYPGGAAYQDGRWIVSFGIDDERCAIGIFERAEVDRTLEPVQ